ncbi:internal virion protein B-like protein [uncultured Mediterranean phage uvMED]|nr:internal virion protein B-like protein [uncultured Mediterranean phage uvMED]
MGAANIFTIGMGLAQYQAQGKIGKYNQGVSNRNAKVLENQALQLEQKAEFDIAQFNKSFKKIEGSTKVATAKSGAVVDSGSAYYVALSNAYEAQLQRNLIEYNAKIAADNKREEATFAIIKGQIARNQASLAQLQTIATTGSSLLTMNQGSKIV